MGKCDAKISIRFMSLDIVDKFGSRTIPEDCTTLLQTVWFMISNIFERCIVMDNIICKLDVKYTVSKLT